MNKKLTQAKKKTILTRLKKLKKSINPDTDDFELVETQDNKKHWLLRSNGVAYSGELHDLSDEEEVIKTIESHLLLP